MTTDYRRAAGMAAREGWPSCFVLQNPLDNYDAATPTVTVAHRSRRYSGQ